MEYDYNAAETATTARDRYSAARSRGEQVIKYLMSARADLTTVEAAFAAAEGALARLAAEEIAGKAQDADTVAAAVAAVESARIALLYPQARVAAAQASVRASQDALRALEQASVDADAAARTAATRARVLELASTR